MQVLFIALLSNFYRRKVDKLVIDHHNEENEAFLSLPIEIFPKIGIFPALGLFCECDLEGRAYIVSVIWKDRLIASVGVLSEGYGDGGPGVCLGDGQTEDEGVPSQGGRGDALLRRMNQHLT